MARFAHFAGSEQAFSQRLRGVLAHDRAGAGTHTVKATQSWLRAPYSAKITEKERLEMVAQVRECEVEDITPHSLLDRIGITSQWCVMKTRFKSEMV